MHRLSADSSLPRSPPLRERVTSAGFIASAPAPFQASGQGGTNPAFPEAVTSSSVDCQCHVLYSAASLFLHKLQTCQTHRAPLAGFGDGYLALSH